MSRAEERENVARGTSCLSREWSDDLKTTMKAVDKDAELASRLLEMVNHDKTNVLRTYVLDKHD